METALEIGVERGFSSSVVLAAMESRGSGHLHSIDLPSAEADRRDFTGHVIPDHLRGRWSLTLGPSQHELPKLLPQLPPIDLFLHDGDHSYDSQRRDLDLVWAAMAPGGVVLVDDVWNPAFYDFAIAHAQRPYLIERYDEHDGIGLLRKS